MEWQCATYGLSFMDALQQPLAHAWLLQRTHASRTGREDSPDLALEQLVADLDAIPNLEEVLRLHAPKG